LHQAPPILIALAEAFASSIPGRTGGDGDYTIDYEKLLRRAGLHDGDAREIAEQDLADAEQRSDGALVIDLHPRSGQRIRIRLKAVTGEAYLFQLVGHAMPRAQRDELAEFFRSAIDQSVPECHREGWGTWFVSLATAAHSGASVQPFFRDDDSANVAMLSALLGVMNWRGESLIRYASVQITGNSKSLEILRPRLESALQAITRSEDTSLETFGILKTPRSVLLSGPLTLHLPNARLDLAHLDGPFTLSAIDIDRADLVTSAPLLLTVENESVFLELARRNPGVLLIQTSYPGSATCQLVAKLPMDLPCYHFGDTDPAGFDILRDLRRRTGRDFHPFLMDYHPGGEALSKQESKLLSGLLGSDHLADLRPILDQIAHHQLKGAFEQEAISLETITAELSSLMEM